MDGLGGTDRGHVAVALVCEQDVLGPEARGGGGHCRRAAVRGLDPVNVDVVVCEDGAAYGRHAHGLLRQVHLVQHLGQYLVHHAVATARAVVHVHLFQQTGLAVNLVFLPDNFFDFHVFRVFGVITCG